MMFCCDNELLLCCGKFCIPVCESFYKKLLVSRSKRLGIAGLYYRVQFFLCVLTPPKLPDA